MIDWKSVLQIAADIVKSYDTPVTLRQLFYRLVSIELIPNTDSMYTSLSKRTAEARRAGTFPDLEDRTRTIHESTTFPGAAEAMDWLASIYRHDRTEGQEWTVFLIVEKNGIIGQLQSWFGRYGVPIVALGGFASQTLVDDVKRRVAVDDRPAACIYAGDYDASGVAIETDFRKRTGCFHSFQRIGLTEAQIIEYRLPELPGKATDSRAASFAAEHGKLFQVELDALQPDVLRELYREALFRFFDLSIYENVLEREDAQRALIQV